MTCKIASISTAQIGHGSPFWLLVIQLVHIGEWMVPACIYPQLDPIRGVEHSKQRSGFGTAGVFSGDFLSSLGGHIE